MKIKEITSRNRRDFTAIYECEHCGRTIKGSGYDDDFFHKDVIPLMECIYCGKVSSVTYRPLQPIYPDGYQV
jgi:primosomal protein N'